jgi:hypothetical protein
MKQGGEGRGWSGRKIEKEGRTPPPPTHTHTKKKHYTLASKILNIDLKLSNISEWLKGSLVHKKHYASTSKN